MPADEVGFEIGKDGLATIVVGVDGGGPAINAAAWAAGMARRDRALLVLVYVEPLTTAGYWTPVPLADSTDSGAAFVAGLRRNAGLFLQPQGVRWEVVHHRGDAARGLESVAEKMRADCIVIGRSHDGTGALGATAKALINLATRPVVVVP